MLAYVLDRYGGPDAAALRDVARPAPGPGEVLVRVRAAGLNPVDFKIRQGMLKAVQRLRFPAVMGNELAGTVEALRSEAAGTCLGSATPPARPGRVLQPPVVVPPPRIEVPAQAPALPAPVPAPPPVAIQRPPAPALCDAGGCWSSDGTHLQRVPPTLVGPRGLCMQQGGLLVCP